MQGFESKLLLNDADILDRGVSKHQLEQYRRKYYQESFGIATWYDAMPHHTFKTLVLPLSFEEAQAMENVYRDGLALFEKKRASDEQKTLVAQLSKRIDACIKEHFAESGAFIKLNTRSPKDTPWRYDDDPQYQYFVDKEMEHLKQRNIPLSPQNVIIAFTKAMNKCMRITSGDEALNLLLRSMRISEDLGKQLDFDKQLYNQSLVLREWIPEVSEHPEREFRCFVHKKQLNAVSQYFADVCYQELQDNETRKLIERELYEFYESIKQYIPQESFVIDFFIGHNKNYVIELNPFHSNAGACLFSWATDRHLFMNGPLEFRYVDKEPTEDLYKSALTLQWERYFISKHHVMNIPGHQKLKEEVNRKLHPTSDNKMLVASCALGVLLVAGLAWFFYK